ncbi:hypothetical protein JCM21900_002016 [Sporobolomyces salmonicolor]
MLSYPHPTTPSSVSSSFASPTSQPISSLLSAAASSSRPPVFESASTRPPISPSLSSPLYSRKAKGNEPVNLGLSMGLCAPIDEFVIVRGGSAPPRSRRSMARDSPSRPRSLSKRRYELPQEVEEKGEYCYCCEGETRDELRVFGVEPSTSEATAWAQGLEVAGPRRGLVLQADDRDDTLVSSVDSVSPVPSLSRSTRPPLFDDDSDADDLSSSDDDSASESLPSSPFSPFTPTSFTPTTPAVSLSRSPSLRKSSVPTTATSDPLLSPSPSSAAPILSFGTSSRGHWLPARPGKLPTASGCTTDPLLPDVPVAPFPLSPPETPTRSTVSRTPKGPPEFSLLTKSLRSLARLPNLTLPNLLPRFPPPDSYLAGSPEPPLKAGWGAAERRRVLEAEPSYEADEARGLLLRRRGSSGTGGWIGGRRGGGPLTVVDDEPETAVLAAAAAAGTGGGELAMEDFTANAAPDPAAPTAASAALPAAPPSLPASPPPSPSASSSSTTESDPFLVAPSPRSPPSPPPSPPIHSQRFISNHRHLLMLSIEFSMMRADKIRSPLRPRAVIVRQGSPSRSGAGNSALRREVLP